MDPTQTEKIIEPSVIAIIRKGITYALTAVCSWLIAKGIMVDTTSALELAVPIAAVLGPAISWAGVTLAAAIIKKYAPSNVAVLTMVGKQEPGTVTTIEAVREPTPPSGVTPPTTASVTTEPPTTPPPSVTP